jgi:hypothetical protein
MAITDNDKAIEDLRKQALKLFDKPMIQPDKQMYTSSHWSDMIDQAVQRDIDAMEHVRMHKDIYRPGTADTKSSWYRKNMYQLDIQSSGGGGSTGEPNTYIKSHTTDTHICPVRPEAPIADIFGLQVQVVAALDSDRCVAAIAKVVVREVEARLTSRLLRAGDTLEVVVRLPDMNTHVHVTYSCDTQTYQVVPVDTAD